MANRCTALVALALLGHALAAEPLQGSISCGQTVSGDTGNGDHVVGNLAKEHQYTFSTSELTEFTFDACDVEFDVYLRIFNFNMTTELDSRDDYGCADGVPTVHTSLTTTLPAGDYVVVIEGYSRNEGKYNLTMFCADGTTTPAPGPAEQGSVVCGDSKVGNTLSGSNTLGNPAPEHVWTITLDQQTNVTVNVCEADFDTYLRILDADDYEVAAKDDGGCAGSQHWLQTALSATLDAGEYRLVVEGYYDNAGHYEMSVGCTVPPPPPVLPCPAGQHFDSQAGVCADNKQCNVVGGHSRDVPRCFRLSQYFSPADELAASMQLSTESADYFREVPSLAGVPNGVSIESCALSGHFLTRVQLGGNARATPEVLLLPEMNYSMADFGRRATWYLRHTHFSDVIERYNDEELVAEPSRYESLDDTGKFLYAAGNRVQVQEPRNVYISMKLTFAKIADKPHDATSTYTVHAGRCRGPGSYTRHMFQDAEHGTESVAEAEALCAATPGCTGFERWGCQNRRGPISDWTSCSHTRLVFHHNIVPDGLNFYSCHMRVIMPRVRAAAAVVCPTVPTPLSEAACHLSCAYVNGAECAHNPVPQRMTNLARRHDTMYYHSNASDASCRSVDESALSAAPGCYHECVAACTEAVRERPRPLHTTNHGEIRLPERQNGFCVAHDGRDVNDDIERYETIHNIRSPRDQLDEDECLEWCMGYPGATGCERIVRQWNFGCYAFTSQRIHHGNGRQNHHCWIFFDGMGERETGQRTPLQRVISEAEDEGCFRVDNLRWGTNADGNIRHYITATHLVHPGIGLAANGRQNDFTQHTWRVRHPLRQMLGYRMLATAGLTMLSLESCEFPGTFLRELRGRIGVTYIQDTNDYSAAATWIVRENVLPGHYSLESYSRREEFLHGAGFGVLLRTRATSDHYMREQSWAPLFGNEESGVANADICEGVNARLQCHSGHVLNIKSAFYGRRDNITCYATRYCSVEEYDDATGTQTCWAMQTWMEFEGPDWCSANATAYVAGRCQGQERCSVRSDNRIFGDPCYRTYKYLHIDYECVAIETGETSRSVEDVTALIDSGAQEFVSVPATPYSDRECQVCRNCTAPEYITALCGEFSNTRCASAVLGQTYVPRDNMLAPIPVRQCVSGTEYEEVMPTLTSPRICKTCQTCPPGTVMTQECRNDMPRICVDVPNGFFSNDYNVPYPGYNITQCAPGEAQSVAPTDTSDRSCAPCILGESYSSKVNAVTCKRVRRRCDGVRVFQTDAPTLVSNRICEDVTPCDWATQYENESATEFSDRKCANLAPCNLTVQFISTRATRVSDRTCTDAKVCNTSTHWMRAEHSEYADTDCRPLSVCDYAFQYEARAPTLLADRVCRNHSVCDSDQYIKRNATTTSDRRCATHSDSCNYEHQFESQSATAFRDRECTDVRVCAQDEYEHQAPTNTSNRKCKPLTVCNTAQYIKINHTDTTDRTCGNITVCNESVEYETQAPTEFRNRQCTPLTICNLSYQYEFEAPAYNRNRMCKNLTVCDYTTQWESMAATPVSNRKCSSIRRCDPWKEWESSPPSTNSNRVCSPLTMCGPHEYISVAKTATSDRQCLPLTQCNPSTEYELDAPGNFTKIHPANGMTLFVEYDTFSSPYSSRFVKLSVDLSVCTTSWSRVYEFEVYAEVNGTKTNVALGAATKVDSEYVSVASCGTADNSTCKSSRAVDGIKADDHSRWLSNGINTSNYLILDLGEVYNITEIRLYAGYNRGQSFGLCQHNISKWLGDDNANFSTVNSDDVAWSLMVAQSMVPTKDRDCEPLSICSDTQYEEFPHDEVTDRTCSPVTVCDTVTISGDEDATEYQQQAATATSDAVCQPLTSCLASEKVQILATNTSDRKCELQLAASSSGSNITSNGLGLGIVAAAAGLALVALVAVHQHKKNKKPPPSYVSPQAGDNPMYQEPQTGARKSAEYYETVYDATNINENPYTRVTEDNVYGAATSHERRPSAALEEGYASGYSRGVTGTSAGMYALGNNEYDVGAASPQIYAMGNNIGGGQMYAGASGAADRVVFAATGHDYAMGAAGEEEYAAAGDHGAHDPTYDNNPASDEAMYHMSSRERSDSYGQALDVDLDAGYNTLKGGEGIYGI